MGKEKISPAEMELMAILWQTEKWVNAAELSELLQNEWKYTTIATFLSRLKKKGFLTSKKEGNVNYFRPSMTKEQYQAEETQEFIQSIHGGSAKSLVASLYKDKINDADFHELMEWLDKFDA